MDFLQLEDLHLHPRISHWDIMVVGLKLGFNIAKDSRITLMADQTKRAT